MTEVTHQQLLDSIKDSHALLVGIAEAVGNILDYMVEHEDLRNLEDRLIKKLTR